MANQVQTAAGDVRLVASGRVDAILIETQAGNIDVLAGGRVDAKVIETQAGDVSVTASGGTIDITDRIGSLAGDVALIARGSIFESGAADDSATPFVIGNSVSLTTGDTVGSASDFFEINSSFQSAGNVLVDSQNGVFLTETSGNLNLDSVAVLNAADVSLLVLSGSIFDSVTESPDDLADIQARNIDLITIGGGIGVSGNPLDIFGAGSLQQRNTFEIRGGVPEQGRLYVLADQDIDLDQKNASLDILRVESTGGNIELSVFDSLSTIEFTTDPLPEDLNLLAGDGQTLTGTFVTGGVITAPSGTVLLDVGDDINIPLTTLVSAATRVTVRGDYGGVLGTERDLGGTTITIESDLQADLVEISGGADLDFIQVIGASGINAGGVTRLQGNAADDRFFVQGNPTALTIQGDDGADRYYLSSNAAKELFFFDGVFNDDSGDADRPFDPFDYLNGTLDTFTANVTIETGAGGGGGTRDVVYASTSGSTTSVSGVVDHNLANDTDSLSGLAMTGEVEVVVPTGTTAFLHVGLGSDADDFQIKGLGDRLIAEVFARDGDDSLRVGNDLNSMADISGIVVFHGGDGSDALDAYGDATEAADPITGIDPDQLTGIGLYGLEMGTNVLFSLHERFGAGFDPGLGANYPAAIYYATRTINNGDSTITSDVEAVNVYLGSGDDTFVVDSVSPVGTTSVFGGAGDDTLTMTSTATGLHPNFPVRVDFADGNLILDGGESDSNTIILDDSGDSAGIGDLDGVNVGTYLGTTVTGLDMTGSVTFANAANIEVRLGVQDDIFYVPATDPAVTVTLLTGGGFARWTTLPSTSTRPPSTASRASP
ncbi:MAG: beta strand repeat-containing protein [Pirellulales bacterium]